MEKKIQIGKIKEEFRHMNLLIVDDEPLEVKIIEQMVDIKKFDLDEIYVAYSMKQTVKPRLQNSMK